MRTEAINLSIRGHEESDAPDWEHSERAGELYNFFGIFSDEFFEGRLPAAVISFRSGRITNLGWYHIGRNEIGVKDQINLNSQHLERPKYQTLVTLLHEMTHEWQDYFGKHSNNRYYHNKQFQRKSMELGIPSNSKGHTIGITDPFIEVCRRYGIEVPERAIEEFESIGKSRGSRGMSKLRKYSCGCTNVWAATRVQAVCKLCGGDFRIQV